MAATGGKSVHCYWVLSEPIGPSAWKPLQQRLLEHADADRSIRNPARVMRLPGCWYMHPGNQAGKLAQIIHESGKVYVPQEIAACLPQLEVVQQIKTATDASRRREQTPRCLEQIRQALATIPPRVPGSNTYAKYRNLLWGLVAACEEGGADRDTAIALMEEHSPAWAD